MRAVAPEKLHELFGAMVKFTKTNVILLCSSLNMSDNILTCCHRADILAGESPLLGNTTINVHHEFITKFK